MNNSLIICFLTRMIVRSAVGYGMSGYRGRQLMEEDWQIGEGPDGQDMLAHEERGDLRMAQGQKA